MQLAEALGTVEAGLRPAGGATEASGTVPSLGGENVSPDGDMRYDVVKRIPVSFFNAMRRGRLQSGDVVINKDGAQTGKAAVYPGDFAVAAINEHLFLLRGIPSVLDQGFLFHFLAFESTQRQLARVITGSAQPGLKSDFAAYLTLDLPLVDEQLRIARTLDRSRAQIKAVEALLQKLASVRQGLASAVLGRGVTADGELRAPEGLTRESPLGLIPNDWELSSLEDLVRDDAPIGYGIVQPGESKHDGVPVLAIHNLPDRFHLNLHRSSATIDAAYARSRVREDDVLLSIKGTTGRVGIVPDGFIGNISRDLARLRVRDGVSPRFLAHMLRAPQTQRRLSQAKVGTTRDEISIGVLRSFRVPLPPMNEQEIIADALDAVDESIQNEAARRAKLVSLHRSVAQQLLNSVVGENE